MLMNFDVCKIAAPGLKWLIEGGGASAENSQYTRKQEQTKCRANLGSFYCKYRGLKWFRHLSIHSRAPEFDSCLNVLSTELPERGESQPSQQAASWPTASSLCKETFCVNLIQSTKEVQTGALHFQTWMNTGILLYVFVFSVEDLCRPFADECICIYTYIYIYKTSLYNCL